MGKQGKTPKRPASKSTKGTRRIARREKTASRRKPAALPRPAGRADDEIAASESLYRRLIETTHEGVRVIDLNGVTTYVNPRMAAMLGYRPDEMVGRNAWEFVWPEDVPVWRAAFQKRKAQDGVHRFDLRLRRKDGSSIWCQASTNMITNAEGQPVGSFSMYADITERKLAEEALRSSEQRLQLALDAGGMGIWAWDLRTGRTIWNAKEYELLGLPPGDGVVRADLFFQHVHAEDGPELHRLVSEVIERGTELVFEFRINRADGQVRWLATVGRLVRDEAGQPLSLIGVNYDITDRKQAEEALRSSEEKFARAFQANPASVAISEISDGRIIEINDSFERIFGHTREEAVGKTPFELHTYAELACRQEVLRRLQRDGRVRDFELPIRTKDGSIRCGRMSATIVPLRGQPHLVTITEDITEQRRAEQDLRILNETLERQVAERTAEAEQRAVQLQHLAGQMTQAEQRERKRLAHVLHDGLQQSLVAARFNLGVLRRHPSNLTQKQALALGQAYDLLREALTTSRSLTAELSPPILYEGSLSQVLHWLGRWAVDRHGLEVNVHVEDAIDPQAEPVRIFVFQAVQELLLNVRKHAKVDRARIQSRRCQDGEIEIAVVDEGAGFEPARKRRLPGGRSRYRFGLFSIRERVGLLGGRMEIDSRPGGGTRIALMLPPQSMHR